MYTGSRIWTSGNPPSRTFVKIEARSVARGDLRGGRGGYVVDADPLLRERHPHRLAPRMNIDLQVDVGQVALDRGLRDVQLRGYPVVGVPTGGEHQYLALPLRERPHGLLPEPLEQAPGHGDHHVLSALIAA